MKMSIIIVIVVLILGFLFISPSIMISPGYMSIGHENIDNKCLSCHQPFQGAISAKCIDCHPVNKIGIAKNKTITNKKILFHNNLKSQDCMSCHTIHNGINAPLSPIKFKHPLLASQLQNNCLNCHSAPINLVHENISPNACISCHTTASWISKIFNHSKLSNSMLSKCISCHKLPLDNFHKQQKSTSCISCHQYTAWKPSTFDHSRYFKFDKNHNNTCSNCHSNNNFQKYSCLNCHEHTFSNLQSEHQEEGITNISKCANCHKSGNEDEIYDGDNNMQMNRKKRHNNKGNNNEENDDDD